MRVYLYPGYVSMRSGFEDEAPRLWQEIQRRGILLEEARWHGGLDSIPTDRPAIVRPSSRMYCTGRELDDFCIKHDLFCLHGDNNLQGFIDFLERSPEKKLTKEDTIPFLRSLPKDRSILGQARHLRKQLCIFLAFLEGEFLIEWEEKRQLRSTLTDVLEDLTFSIDETNSEHGMVEFAEPYKNVALTLATTVQAFKARRENVTVASRAQETYDTALPQLIEKLIKSGYVDNGISREWED